MNDTLLVMLIGFGMGFFGSIPPLGPVALMIINRAFQKQLKFAFAAGVGGALAEVIYSALAVTGVGLLLNQVGAARSLLALTSAGILLLVGIYFLCSPLKGDAGPKSPEGSPALDPPEESALAHLARGFSIAIVNPILIVNWTLAVAYFFTLFQLRADLVGQILFAGAVGVGKIVWTAIEVWLLDKFRKRYPFDLLRRVQRGVSIAVIVSALFLAVKTLAAM
jgi:threonine/homoserine/homoserine lactone efflux protein